MIKAQTVQLLRNPELAGPLPAKSRWQADAGRGLRVWNFLFWSFLATQFAEVASAEASLARSDNNGEIPHAAASTGGAGAAQAAAASLPPSPHHAGLQGDAQASQHLLKSIATLSSDQAPQHIAGEAPIELQPALADHQLAVATAESIQQLSSDNADVQVQDLFLPESLAHDLLANTIQTVSDVVANASDLLLPMVEGEIAILAKTTESLTEAAVRQLENPMQVLDAVLSGPVAGNLLDAAERIASGPLDHPVLRGDELFQAGRYTDYNLFLQRSGPDVAALPGAVNEANHAVESTVQLAQAHLILDHDHAAPSNAMTLPSVIDDLHLRGHGDWH
jgi:hypothetical protein